MPSGYTNERFNEDYELILSHFEFTERVDDASEMAPLDGIKYNIGWYDTAIVDYFGES